MLGTTRTATTESYTRTAEKTRRIAGRFVSATLAFSLLTAPTAALAAKRPTDRIGGKSLASGQVSANHAPDIDAAAGALVDQDGRVLWGRGASTPRPMASTTKMMTALLVLERVKMDKKIRVSKRAAATPYGIGLKAGEWMTAGQLLNLMLVVSSNDAAYALGEYVGGGSMPRFVKLMNARAAELGLEDTKFKNPHGLDAPGHYASPMDLATLSRAVMKHHRYRKAAVMRSVKLPGHKGRPARSIKATDKLLGRYWGLQGGKTGFTNKAMYSFVASATRGDETLTVVVLGARSNDARFGQAARLLDWGFKNLETRRLAAADEAAGEVAIASTDGLTVPVALAAPATAKIFRPDGKVVRKPSLPAAVKLPVVAGQKLGTVEIAQGDRVLASVPAVATKTMLSAEETVGAVPVADYLDRSVVARAAKSDAAPELDAATPVERVVKLDSSVSAPVAPGDKLGEIRYLQGGKVVARVPVVSTAAVAEPTLVESIKTSVARGWLGIVGGPTMAEPVVSE